MQHNKPHMLCDGLSQNMCLGHASAVQIASGTDHMKHEMGATVVRKDKQLHRESTTRTSPREDIDKSCACLKIYFRNVCPKCLQTGVYIYSVPLGASCASFGAPIGFLMRQMHPKSSRNDDEIAKLTPKDVPRT